jgi:hypothetical protein
MVVKYNEVFEFILPRPHLIPEEDSELNTKIHDLVSQELEPSKDEIFHKYLEKYNGDYLAAHSVLVRDLSNYILWSLQKEIYAGGAYFVKP